MKNIYLNVVVALGGSVILALEILGTRILGPFYGSSIFLWSVLISITLLALSIGYLLGGKCADARPNIRPLSLFLAVAGVWLLAIPWLRHPVLSLAEPWGLRIAVFTTATLLFLPPLTLLGMISPYAIKLKTAGLESVGRTAGRLYALSTFASVIAALGTALFLIPNFGIGNILFGMGILLLLCAMGGYLLERKPLPITGASLLLLSAPFCWQAYHHEDPNIANGLLALRHSMYAELRVVDRNGERHLLIDGSLHALVDTTDWLSHYPYVSVMEMPKYLVEKPGAALLLGVGAGSLAGSYAADGWHVDGVEIDPVVIDLARQYFHLQSADARIITMDGRQFLASASDRYNVILLDAFGSSSIPFHLVTAEVFHLMRERMTDEGILAINCEAIGWNDNVVRSISATLRQEFSHVIALPIAEPPSEFGNVILLASNKDFHFYRDLPRNYLDPNYRYSGDYWKVHGWDNAFSPDTAGALILTDECNPIDIMTENINYTARMELHKYFEAKDGWTLW